MGDKMWTQPKRPAQPVQQAQTLIQGGTLNSVAAIMVRDDIKPMIALDFIARLGYILPCHDVVHAVGSDYALCGDGSIGQVKHQKHLAAALRTGKHRWNFKRRHHLSGIQCECLIRIAKGWALKSAPAGLSLRIAGEHHRIFDVRNRCK